MNPHPSVCSKFFNQAFKNRETGKLVCVCVCVCEIKFDVVVTEKWGVCDTEKLPLSSLPEIHSLLIKISTNKGNNWR